MFNPIKAAGSLVSGIAESAKIAAKVKTYWDRANEDTDGDNLPQYENILQVLEEIKDELRPTLGVLKKEFEFYSQRVLKLYELCSALFLHVLEAQSEKTKS